MTDQTNTPELRFPEFKKEWQCNTLDNCCYKISDGIHSTPIYSKSGDFSFINGNNLINGKIHFENAKLVDSKEALKHKRNLTYNETILLSINGTIGNIALYRGEKIILGKSAAYINIKANFLNPLFLYYFLETNSLQRYFRSELTGTTIKNLSIKSIKKTKLYIPNITEQRKIGDFFSKLDQQIELEEKKLELLEQQKRGYMQKIFSQELQFKDKVTNNFDNWSEFKIKDIFSKIESGNRLPKSNLLDGDIPYVIAQTTNNGVYMNISKDTLDYHGNNLKKFKKGSITISIDNPDAMFIQTQDFVTSNVMRVLYNENLSIEAHTFILYSLRKLTQTYNWSVKFSGPIIMDSKIKLPVKLNTNDIDWNIVNKIGEFLTKLDFKIYQNTTKVELLKQRKKGLLQKMFV